MKPFVVAIRVAVCAIATLRANGVPPGDVYHGEFISEDQHGVTIAIDPCSKSPTRITIRYYSLSELGKHTCPGTNGRTFRNVQVVEGAPPPTGHEKDKDKKDKDKDQDKNKEKETNTIGGE